MKLLAHGRQDNRYFIAGIISLCLFYLFFELFFNSYSMITVDEFWFAHRIYQYKDGLPYRDFAPYKTVLGYYLLLPAMLVKHNVIATLVFMKDMIAVVNSLVLLAASLWLTRFFSRPAILASLALLVFSETLLTYSTQIRVDLPAYWFALFAILLLLENRYILAGLLMGLGFITSQKCIWYIFACNCALAVNFLLFTRNKKFIANIILFNLSCLSLLCLYIGFWSWMSSWQTVFNSIFQEASIMYALDSYESARKLYWHTIIQYNPVLFLLCPFTLISALITDRHDTAYKQRIFILTISTVMMICLLFYKQPFPYYMQVMFPVFLLLYTAFFDWLVHMFTVTTWAAYLRAPYAKLCISTIFIAIVIYPLAPFLKKISHTSSLYQKANLETTRALLADNSDYLAGIELFYDRTQPIAGLRHLGLTALDYLRAPSEKLRPAMLASLYATPDVTMASAIEALKKSYVKLYINNYRMNALPAPIKAYLASEYEHLWSSIYLYSPTITPQNTHPLIRFTGKYELESGNNSRVSIDGHYYQNHAQLRLASGIHQSSSRRSYRLKLMPENIKNLDPDFQNDQWQRIMF